MVGYNSVNMATYVVHPGSVVLLHNNEEVAFTAQELAEAYGLGEGEYISSDDKEYSGTYATFRYIHLYPRRDGNYSDIKDLLGDTGEDFHYDVLTATPDKDHGGLPI